MYGVSPESGVLCGGLGTCWWEERRRGHSGSGCYRVTGGRGAVWGFSQKWGGWGKPHLSARRRQRGNIQATSEGN